MFKPGDIAILSKQGSYSANSDPSLGAAGQCVITESRPDWIYESEEFVRLLAPSDEQRQDPFVTMREKLKKI